ncbi:hypothetical protein [Nocardioides sp. GXZ039]|uniref:hypothetical protein n=1 Tax=Nocardioides sp. GXZ039 TaxID=3136018 RepID=UPI0030F3D46C
MCGGPLVPDQTCDVAGVIVGSTPAGAVINGVQGAEDAASAVKEGLSFASDPLGYLADKAQGAAQSLSSDILPAMTHAMEPDLSADWFLNAYRTTFAIAILVWVLQLLWAFVQHARRKISSSEMVDILVARSPMFIIGCMFGPPLGAGLVKLFGALTDSMINEFIGGTSDEVAAGLNEMLNSGDPDQIAGGPLVALVIYAVMVLGLLTCLVTLLVMLVTQYLSGVFFPLAWQYITSANQKHRAWSIAKIWIGIMMSHPLMFLLLGVSLKMATGTLLGDQLPGREQGLPEGIQVLLGLAMCCIALWMTALSPLALSKLAPVLPTGAGSTDGVNLKSIPRPSGNRTDASNALAQRSQTSEAASVDAGVGGGDGQGGGGSDVLATVGGGSSSGAAEGAAAGAEEAAAAGAETGPGDVLIAGAGAAAGAAAGAVKDAEQDAEEQAGQAAGGGADGGGDDVSSTVGPDSGDGDGSPSVTTIDDAATPSTSAGGEDVGGAGSGSGGGDVASSSASDAPASTDATGMDADKADSGSGAGGGDDASNTAESADESKWSRRTAWVSREGGGRRPRGQRTQSRRSTWSSAIEQLGDEVIAQADDHSDRRGGAR